MKNRRALNRKLLKILPPPMRYKVLRNHVPLCGKIPDELEITIARSEEELSTAYRLLHDSYVSAGFMKPHATGMRVLLQHMTPQASTIVAKWEGKVIGTLSLIRDNPFGLPLEKLFDLSSRRAGGRRLAEVSSLAVEPAFRGKVTQVLFPLFRYVYRYASNCFGTHEFVIAVNPAMEDLYRAFLLFERIDSKQKPYDFVNGAPAVGLYLNFDGLVERWRRAFTAHPEHLKWFHEETSSPRDSLPQRDYYVSTDPIMTPRLLEQFFLKRAGLGRTLSGEQIWLLSNEWNASSYREVFAKIPEISKWNERREVRFDVQMPALAGTGKEICEVLNVSLNGLQVRSTEAWERGQNIALEISISPSRSIRIEACVAWTQPGVFGLELLSTSLDWVRMIRAFQKRIEVLTREKPVSEPTAYDLEA